MKELSVFNHNGVDVIDSREVAEMVEKNHGHLMRDISNYIKIMEKANVSQNGEVGNESKIGLVANELKIEAGEFFIPSSYVDGKGEARPCYLITKKGCDMVANKMTGEKGVLFTAAYVSAFEKMRKHIQNEVNQIAQISQALSAMAMDIQSLSDMVHAHNAKLDAIKEKVDKVEKEASYSNYYLRLQMRSGYDENWRQRQSKNINAISEFIGVDGKQLLQEIYREMENRYGVVLEKFAVDYKRTKGLSTCSTLSVISFSITLREMFDAIIREIMGICRLSLSEDANAGRSRIFDLAEEAATEHTA